MTFTVTYRAKDGALREERVEAASRAECVAECRRRGIAPTGIKEGGSGKSAASPMGRDKRGPSRVGTGDSKRTTARWMAVAVVAVVAIAGGVWWWIGGRGAAALPAEKPAKPKVEKPQKPKTTSVQQQGVEKPKAEKPAPAATNDAPKAAEKPPEFVKRPGALQLPDGKVLTFPAPKEGEIRKVYAYGHMYECDHEGNFRDVTRRQLFKTAFEANFLGLAIADKPFIPAFLKGLDQEDVKKILLKPYEPKGDETEEETEQIKAYDAMRATALQFMEEGGTFDDFVDYFATQVKNERETNALCLREVMQLYKQGKFDEAKEMAEAANALKRQKGLNDLKLPAHVRERLGL